MSEDERLIRFSFELPTDRDGFVRRQCSTCGRQFKWHAGSANEESERQADADVCYCPMCGTPAEPGDWTTPEQDDYIQVKARRASTPALDQMIGSFLDGLKGPNITVKRTGHLETLSGADPLVEPDDMVIVVSPCHGYEPVKVSEDWADPLHCLVCGSKFVL